MIDLIPPCTVILLWYCWHPYHTRLVCIVCSEEKPKGLEQGRSLAENKHTLGRSEPCLLKLYMFTNIWCGTSQSWWHQFVRCLEYKQLNREWSEQSIENRVSYDEFIKLLFSHPTFGVIWTGNCRHSVIIIRSRLIGERISHEPN